MSPYIILIITPISIYHTFVSDLFTSTNGSIFHFLFCVASAFESFQLGAGYPTLVHTYTRSFPMPTKHTAHTLLNTSKTKVWRSDGPTQGRCIWEYHDVWRWSNSLNKAVALRENYFRQSPETGGKVRASQLTSFSHIKYTLIAGLDSLVY